MAYMADFQPLSPRERETVAQVTEIITGATAIPCTACRYCVDDCPQHIAIPNYFALYNNQAQFGMGASNRSYYSNLTKRYGMASECIQCGLCESHCPQHLDIRGWLGKVAEVFGK